MCEQARDCVHSIYLTITTNIPLVCNAVLEICLHCYCMCCMKIERILVEIRSKSKNKAEYRQQLEIYNVNVKLLPASCFKVLAADHGHTAIGAFETFVTDVVFEFFVPDGPADSGGKIIIGSIGTDDCSQVGFFGGEEAGA